MMTGLGALGFWLGLGIFLAAGSIAGALKERDKQREKGATLRALLQRGGEGTSEILAYLREKDAAEAERARAVRAAMGSAKGLGALGLVGSMMVATFSMFGGVIAQGQANMHGASWQVSVGLMFAIWVVGFVIAGLIGYIAVRERKKAPPRNA